MRLSPTPYQEQYQSSIRGLLRQLSPEPVVREQMTAPSYDRELWRRLCSELGLGSLGVPEELGGDGGGLADLVVVFEELGRCLAVVPALGTLGLARAALVASADTSALTRWLPPIMAGELTATLAGSLDAAVPARATGQGYVLDGSVTCVLDGADADLLLVVGDLPEAGPTLFACEASDRTSWPTLDLTRRLGEVRFSEAPAQLVGAPGGAAFTLPRVLDTARVLLAAEQLGGLAWCLDDAVGYAQERVQFGRAIGSFQVVKHRCADMLVEAELARTAVRYAAWVADEHPAELASAAAMAKATCSEAFVELAGANLQLHGGLGFTWEHSAHLYLKRAQSSRVLLGEPSAHRRALAAHLGL
jgi:alkylation response protein AidB-like acyl-CoA dehydrogenase